MFLIMRSSKCLPFRLPTEGYKAVKRAKQTTKRDYRKARFVPRGALSALRRKVYPRIRKLVLYPPELQGRMK